MSREQILLRAAYDILTKCNDGFYVKDAMSVTAYYDEAMCDGHCLREDISTELGLAGNERPLEGIDNNEQ
jgi:hypothetical protein